MFHSCVNVASVFLLTPHILCVTYDIRMVLREHNNVDVYHLCFTQHLVVDVNHEPLLSENTCLTLGLIKYYFKIETIKEGKPLEDERKRAQEIHQSHSPALEGMAW